MLTSILILCSYPYHLRDWLLLSTPSHGSLKQYSSCANLRLEGRCIYLACLYTSLKVMNFCRKKPHNLTSYLICQSDCPFAYLGLWCVMSHASKISYYKLPCRITLSAILLNSYVGTNYWNIYTEQYLICEAPFSFNWFCSDQIVHFDSHSYMSIPQI
jgi:hypothetical protein